MSRPPGWLVEHRHADAAALHEDWPGPAGRARRALCRCEPVGAPALVIGSSQRAEVADEDALARAATTLVRRRSGGGAVRVAPGAQLWVDAWVPAGDDLWDADVVRGAFWLGDLWAAALGALGVRGVEVHRGRAERGPWSAVLCFAGMGPGEVSVGGRKLVGLAQRRSAAGTRLSSMALVDVEPRHLLVLLRLSGAERARARAALAGGVTGLTAVLPGQVRAALLDAVFDALVAALPAPT